MSLRDELQAIYDQHGRLTPELVVQAARPKNHPLHDRVFDRPPAEAAQAYYRNRAHELITEYKVVVRPADEQGPEVKVRAWHAVRSDEGFVYEPLEKVATDPFLSRLVLADMQREWKQMRDRYGHMKEFVDVVRADLLGDEAAAA